MSNNEYEQQQFWEDKPVEVILGDNSSWDHCDRRIIWVHEKEVLVNLEYIKRLNNEK